METTLEVVRRERFGRNEAIRIRAEGHIPAVLYGGASKPESLTVDPKALLQILHSDSGANTLIALSFEGRKDTRVLIKEYQLHPVTRRLLHADFYRVAMDKELRVTVPIQLTGEARGVKEEGGILDFVHREIEVECLPADIPENITVDVSELMLHDGVRVRDLPVDAKWRPASEGDTLIVHVVAPRAEAEPAVADAAVATAATAEPEVIKKGKVEKEDDKKDDKKG
jgi:large subunit ribosomal protein L25